MGFSDQISGFLFTNGLLLLVFSVNITTFPLMLKVTSHHTSHDDKINAVNVLFSRVSTACLIK